LSSKKLQTDLKSYGTFQKATPNPKPQTPNLQDEHEVAMVHAERERSAKKYPPRPPHEIPPPPPIKISPPPPKQDEHEVARVHAERERSAGRADGHRICVYT